MFVIALVVWRGYSTVSRNQLHRPRPAFDQIVSQPRCGQRWLRRTFSSTDAGSLGKH